MPNDLLAELAQIDGIEASSRPTTTTSRPSTASSSTPATTRILARVLDLGGAGGILVASHIVGDEMRRMVDEPDERAAIESLLPVCRGAVRRPPTRRR